MTRFNYIVTIHNKEDLIERVVEGLLRSAGEDSHIYLVLDGCTDGTEQVVDRLTDENVGLPITKLHAPDVHEILSLNIAFRQVPMEGDGFNILVQDDVILADWNFEKKVVAVNRHFGNRIGVLSFRHGVNVVADDALGEIREMDVVESCYGQGMDAKVLQPEHAVARMVCLRSPECISFETIRRIGLLDEKYAPYTYDDHDYGLRCLRAGLVNVVYALKTRSRVEWGGMRRKPQPGVVRIMKRNRGYVYQDHKDFLATLRADDFRREPVLIDAGCAAEPAETAMRRYAESLERAQSYSRRQRFDLIRRLREKLAF
jgi:glycosyltransferase involved in cell wall biosynthesis